MKKIWILLLLVWVSVPCWGYTVTQNRFVIDSGVTDHGAATAEGNRSVKDFVDAYSGSTPIAIELSHIRDPSSGTSSYTDFRFQTAETIPADIKIIMGRGTRLDPDSGVTVTVSGGPGQIKAEKDQMIITGDGTVAFSIGGELPLGWYGFSATESAANNATYLMSGVTIQNTYGGKLTCLGGNYSINGAIPVGTQTYIEGIAPLTYGLLVDGEYDSGSYTRFLCSNDDNLFEVADTANDDRADGVVFRNLVLDVASNGQSAIVFDSVRHPLVQDCLIVGPTNGAEHPLVEIVDTNGKGYAYMFERNCFYGGTYQIDADANNTSLPASRIKDCIFNSGITSAIIGPFQGVIENCEFSAFTEDSGVTAIDGTETTAGLFMNNISIIQCSFENIDGVGMAFSGYGINVLGGSFSNSSAQANCTHAIRFYKDTTYYPYACTVSGMRISGSNTHADFSGIELSNESSITAIDLRSVYFASFTTQTPIVDPLDRALKDIRNYRPKELNFDVTAPGTQTNINNDANALDGTTITWSAETFDNSSDFASNVYTVPMDGIYHFDLYLALENVDSAVTDYRVMVVASGATEIVYVDASKFSADVGYYPVHWSRLISANADDTVQVKIYQYAGTEQTDIGSESYFSGHLVQ